MSASTADVARRLLVFVAVLDVAYVVNCLSPFLGLKYENSQAMYSQLDARARNHLVLPRLADFGGDRYVRDVEITVPPALEDDARALRWFTDFANGSGRALHLPFLAYHFDRLCEAAGGAPIGLRYVTEQGEARRHDDVCAEASLRDSSPIGLYPACDPECYGELEVWASGRWRDAAAEPAAP